MELIPHNRWVNRPEYEEAALRVLRSGHVGQGVEVERLEAALAKRFSREAACVVTSGTVALTLALADAYQRGNETGPWKLEMPSYACSALLDAAETIGMEVSFCDVDGRTLNAVQGLLGPPTYCSSGIFVHTYGEVGKVPQNWIEDFTHAPGGAYGGAPCGSMGVLSVISFGATKPLGAGAGGAVLGPFGAIERIRDRRDYHKLRGEHRLNFQLGDVYAAIIMERLKLLENENRWRYNVACLYDAQRAQVWTGAPHTHYRYVIRVADWRGTQRHFLRYDVETINPLRIDELLHRRSSSLGLPVSERVASTTLSLPIWPGMTVEQVDRVALALKELP